MSRDNYNYGSGHMGNNKDQNRMVRDVAREVGVDPERFSRYVHEMKDDWYKGDYSYQELIELAKEFKRKG